MFGMFTLAPLGGITSSFPSNEPSIYLFFTLGNTKGLHFFVLRQKKNEFELHTTSKLLALAHLLLDCKTKVWA